MLTIGQRKIGPGEPCYIIAEMSANHGGSLERAKAIVRAAKDAGADAVKLQTYTPDTMTLDCDNEYFRVPKGSLWEGKTLYQLYQEAMTPREWHAPLKAEADRLGIGIFSTPFDETSVDFLETLGMPAYKIASFELTDDVLLRKVGATRKPVILSTGMASINEIARAVSLLYGSGVAGVALLKCVSAYPAPLDQMNLRGIPTLRRLFQVSTGLSDHSLGDVVPAVAAALGIQILEKHFRLDDGHTTADSAFSMTPKEFKAMVGKIREVETALGDGRIAQAPDEKDNTRFRRSIFVAADVAKGKPLTEKNVRVVRPGFGLPPSDISRVVGGAAARDLRRGEPLKATDVSGFAEPAAGFELRPASMKDAQFVFELKNDPEAVRQSISGKPVVWEDHLPWMELRMITRKSLIWIIEQKGVPVGQVRFDMDSPEIIVSIALTSAARSKGLGSAALAELSRRVAGEHAGRPLKAFVLPGNTASVTCFFKAGYAFCGLSQVKGVPSFTYEFVNSIVERMA